MPDEEGLLQQPMANSRNADPVTSKEGAEATEESGNAATWRKRCLDAVRQRPGQTAGEYAAWFEVERTVFSRRLPELRELQLVRNGEPKPCEITGKRGLTWWPHNGELKVQAKEADDASIWD